MQACHRALSAVLCGTLLGSSVMPRTAWADPPAEPPAVDKALRKGVTVLVCEASLRDVAWPLATLVYREPGLRPAKVDEETARVLVGEKPGPGATDKQKELGELGPALCAPGASSLRLMASVSSDLGDSALLVVRWARPGLPQAQLFSPASRTIIGPVLWPQRDARGELGWQGAVTWLAAHGPMRVAARTESTPSSSKSVFKSGWFWGALGAAAGVVLIGLAVSKDDSSSQTIHLQGRVGQ